MIFTITHPQQVVFPSGVKGVLRKGGEHNDHMWKI